MRKDRNTAVREIDESSHRDLLTKYLFERGYLPGKCLCVRGIGVSWKIVCVQGLDRVSWKIVCVRGLDRAFWKMEYLFDYKIEAPGKFVCVRGLNKGFWKN